MQKQLESVLAQEVSRKEFLTMSGLAVASIFGFGTVIKFLTGHSLTGTAQNSSHGYGSSVYGGK